MRQNGFAQSNPRCAKWSGALNPGEFIICELMEQHFLFAPLGSPVQVCKDRGAVRFIAIELTPADQPQSANALRPFSNHHAPDRRPAV